MVSIHDKWMRIFDIPEVSKHKNGFTIYKVMSMLYPESCPEAVTKVTVWKRFNDFKKLHREMKVLHRKLKLESKYPSLPSKTLFKRFDEETIQERKESILNFLEFIGSNQQLFTSNEFVKFLESSHTPKEYLTSNINLIRADLNLPEDPEVCTNLGTVSDEEKTYSDTDSVTTLGSLSPSVQTDVLSDIFPHQKLKKLNSSTSINSQASSRYSDSLSTITTLDNIILLDGQMYPTPLASTNVDESMQYIIDASVHVNLAKALEEDRKYEEAYSAYKTAIDILSKFGKDEPNYDRKQLVRYKIEKYNIKAEKIYNMYLAPEIKDIQITNEEEQHRSAVQRPLFDLYKFKVVKVIASGMLVLHSELQQLFYIKVIHKSAQFQNENLILPENVPYMIKLRYHYNCENALFLVLEYISCLNILDYIKNQSTLSDDIFARRDTQILNVVQEDVINECEQSFSELIDDYNKERLKKSTLDVSSASNIDNSSSDDSYEKVEIEDCQTSPEDLCHGAFEELLQESKRKFRTERNLSQISSSFDFDLDDLNPTPFLSEEIVVKWAAQLLLSLERLHQLGVVCRDLNTKNLLVDEKGDLVLTYMCNAKDFGNFVCDNVDCRFAPEIFTFQKVTSAADWWSYGVILYELLVGISLSEVYPNGINSLSNLKIPSYVSPEARSLLRQLLIVEPNDRLGSGVNGPENIKSHPFFYAHRWDTRSFY